MPNKPRSSPGVNNGNLEDGKSCPSLLDHVGVVPGVESVSGTGRRHGCGCYAASCYIATYTRGLGGSLVGVHIRPDQPPGSEMGLFMGTKRRDDKLVHGGKDAPSAENKLEVDESNSFSAIEVTMDGPLHNSSIAAYR